MSTLLLLLLLFLSPITRKAEEKNRQNHEKYYPFFSSAFLVMGERKSSGKGRSKSLIGRMPNTGFANP
jgi:uncharacterized membrane protein YadS